MLVSGVTLTSDTHDRAAWVRGMGEVGGVTGAVGVGCGFSWWGLVSREAGMWKIL